MNITLYKEAQQRLALGEVPASQRAVLKEIISLIRQREDLFYGSILNLAQSLGRHKSNVREDVFALRDRGLLVVVEKGKGKASKYRVCLDSLPTTRPPVEPTSAEIDLGSDRNLTWARITPDLTPRRAHKGFEGKNKGIETPVDQVWNYFHEETNQPSYYTFTVSRRRQGNARFAEALTKCENDDERAIALMRCAVDALRDSPWHNGKNDQKRKYNGWESVFGTPEKFENWLKRSGEEQ